MNRIHFPLLLVPVFCVTTVFAADKVAGRVKTVSEPAHIIRGTDTFSAKAGMSVIENDTLLTGRHGSIGIVFTDNSTLSLGQGSKFQLSKYEFDVLENKADFFGKIWQGAMVYLSGMITRMNAGATSFETPVAVAGVRGTRLAIKVAGGSEHE